MLRKIAQLDARAITTIVKYLRKNQYWFSIQNGSPENFASFSNGMGSPGDACLRSPQQTPQPKWLLTNATSIRILTPFTWKHIKRSSH